ncbi:MAG: hypothetical protein IJ600_11775 [Lachnospiraceae bacterium]|nr:hypothetical protein [Lachnospiraceae bacterium]
MAGAYVIGGLIVAVLTIIADWKIFEKAGEAGWKSLIPFYNLYIMFKIAWGNGWLALLLLVPCVGSVFMIIMNYKLVKAFGQGIGFFILSIFFPNITWLILAFGDSQYIGPQ